MYKSRDRLIIIDADGTVIDAFTAIGTAFARHGMDPVSYTHLDVYKRQRQQRPGFS